MNVVCLIKLEKKTKVRFYHSVSDKEKFSLRIIVWALDCVNLILNSLSQFVVLSFLSFKAAKCSNFRLSIERLEMFMIVFKGFDQF